MVGQTTCPCPTNYRSIHTPPPAGGGHHGGSAIFLRSDVPSSLIQLRSPLQAVAVLVHVERTFTICSLYMPPNEVISRRELEDLIQELPRPFIFLGDMSTRHPICGDAMRNPRGDYISRMIEDSDLVILNTGEIMHFHVQTGSLTAIDLTMASPDIALDFT